MIQIGIDTGGTFTDYVATGSFRGVSVDTAFVKSPTRHGDLAEGFMGGLEKLALKLDATLEEMLSETQQIVHGSTLALNALIEKKGVRTALFTTQGFRDALEIRRAQLKNQWNIQPEIPEVLVPRRLRLGIGQRMDYSGKVLRELDEDSVREACKICGDSGVKSIAVSYLFSFMNMEHEMRTAQIIKEELPDVFVTLSSDVSPKIREYERTSTTVLNAYLTPVLADYLADVEERLSGYGWDQPIHMMMNSGGISDTQVTARYAVKTLFSGPVGGACGNETVRKMAKSRRTILADMGGTSFDVHVAGNDEVKLVPQAEIAGYPLTIPTVDIASVGSGGGSIAHLDVCGNIQLGPQSAGSVPGPACYGLGGEEPTTTDALMILGLMDEDGFLGGTMPLNKNLAYDALEKKVAKPLGMSVPEAARIIYRIASEKMSDAIRLVTVKRGQDPRKDTLIGAGGAFGLFAANVMDTLHIKEALFPVVGPVFCSWGMLGAARRTDFARSFFMNKETWDLERINKIIRHMKEEGKLELERLGVEQSEQEFTLTLEMRYIGQHHEISVPWHGLFQDGDIKGLSDAFHELHESLYGFMEKDKDWEIIHLHLACHEKEKENEISSPKWEKRAVDHRLVAGEPFGLPGDLAVPVVYHGCASDGSEDPISGPALLQMDYTTILVPNGFSVRLIEKGLMSMTRVEVNEHA